ALLYEPDLLILDEPFSGLDPIITKELKDIILAYRAKGKTVFFSSHILGDVAQLCDRVAIINKGVLVRECAVGDLTGDLTLEDAFYNIITGKN
ncbi:MAG TPA: ABC transporter ATP-binding protein, partial [Spirochaetota bacterium]|nr:ABC transporter ATP-binding protein [Spirochaetota bacterium]